MLLRRMPRLPAEIMVEVTTSPRTTERGSSPKNASTTCSSSSFSYCRQAIFFGCFYQECITINWILIAARFCWRLRTCPRTMGQEWRVWRRPRRRRLWHSCDTQPLDGLPSSSCHCGRRIALGGIPDAMQGVYEADHAYISDSVNCAQHVRRILECRCFVLTLAYSGLCVYYWITKYYCTLKLSPFHLLPKLTFLQSFSRSDHLHYNRPLLNFCLFWLPLPHSSCLPPPPGYYGRLEIPHERLRRCLPRAILPGSTKRMVHFHCHRNICQVYT